MATAVAPRIVGLEDNETTLDLPDSLRNTADAVSYTHLTLPTKA